MTKRIAVLGAGPKAAAMLHWRWAWQRAATAGPWGTLPSPPDIEVFESGPDAAAHWDGTPPLYSDGTPELCTPAKYDVTRGAAQSLPPRLGPGGVRLPKGFRAAFDHQMSRGEWTKLRGLLRPPTRPDEYPSHKQLADYIRTLIGQATANDPGATVHYGTEVDGLDPQDDGRWKLCVRGEGDVSRVFDAVVITGPGPSGIRLAHDPSRTPVEAEDYWAKAKPRIDACRPVAHVPGDPVRVVIAGAGGAAAAIALDLCREYYGTSDPDAVDVDEFDNGAALSVVFVAPQASLFTRGESRWENEVLTDDGAWQLLSGPTRADVAEHLLTGVVFRRVLHELERWGHLVEISLRPGYVSRVRGTGAGPDWQRPGRLCTEALIAQDAGGFGTLDCDFVVNAAGFDPMVFVGLIRSESVVAVFRSLGRGGVAQALDATLRVRDGCPWAHSTASRSGANLHAPMLAGGARAPGFGSLLKLGETAGRVLRRYFS